MDLSTKTPKELATEASTLANGFEYLSYGGVIYAPMNFLTEDDSVIPPDDHKCWKRMTIEDVRVKANEQFLTMFSNWNQSRDYYFMVSQCSTRVPAVEPWLLIKTAKGLMALHEDGKLHEHDGRFLPNTLKPTLNEDPDDKAAVFNTIKEWLGNEEEEARSLLRHLATTLAPHWSAGKYVLLIGDGRNGKSVLMSMLQDLFGPHNCSSVTRQQMSALDKTVFDLNGMLLNVVFDGPAAFVKDSGSEKSIITGEQVKLRKLFKDEGTPVKTNALFIEGLNQEPKSRDKSSALQARLVRFWFPNKYKDDLTFEEHMRSDRMLGAFLSLLIDHYVLKHEKSVMLAPTATSRQLQLEHMEDNSVALQFIVHLEETDPLGAEAALIGEEFEVLVAKFQSWRLKLNDLTVWDKQSLANLFRPVIVTERRSKRVAGRTPIKVRYVTAFKQETLDLLESMKEDAHATAVVDD